MNNELKIRDDEQLFEFLALKDELTYVFDEFRFAKGGSNYAFRKLRKRLISLNNSIEEYVRVSDTCFPIVCLENEVIEPQEEKEIKTNIIGLHVNDANIIFDGMIPSAGYLKLSYLDKKYGTAVLVKNNMPREAFDNWDICGYFYNSPMTTKGFDPGVYRIEEHTIVGIGKTDNKELVKTIKHNKY